mgnify:FL=1
MRYEQLGQVRPSNTSNTVLFTPTRGNMYRFKIVIANTTGSAATYRLFHDDDGTTYDETSALAWDISLAAAAKTEFPTDGWMAADNSAGNVAVRSGTGSALTFTAYGISEKVP